MSSLLVLPTSVRSTKELNRELFTVKVNVPYIKLQTKSVSKVISILKKYILKLPKFKSIQGRTDATIAYLDPDKVKNFDILKEDKEILMNEGEYFQNAELTLNYDNFTANQILKSIMPDDIDIPSSFSTIGHIIHLNLQDCQLPFAKIIGQVYLDKIPNIKTVVNKIGNIDSMFRFFKMEILAGDSNTLVTVKENKCTYTFDFAKVYWNPKLSTEHQILTDLLNPEDVLYDVFAGVGPFAIPAAKSGTTVLANDLNPESYTWLKHNAKNNKIENNIEFYNVDGREFIRHDVKKHILNRRQRNILGLEHIVMNLPASAVEFLDVFKDWLLPEETDLVYSKDVCVHVYCFVKLKENENPIHKSKCLVEQYIGYELTNNILKDIHFVRNVAPNKEMMRVSFLLVKNSKENEEPAKKKLKTYNNGKFGNEFIGGDGSQTRATKTGKECFQIERSSNNESQKGPES